MDECFFSTFLFVETFFEGGLLPSQVLTNRSINIFILLTRNSLNETLNPKPLLET